MHKLIPVALLLALSLGLNACSTGAKTEASAPDTSTTDYPSLVKKYSANAQKYDGFHATFEVHATILNSEVNVAILDQRTKFLSWTPEQQRQEREKSFQEMAAYSKIFMSFYSPENDYDDLSKPNSMWKVYLETNGQRYEGKVKKDLNKMAELRQLYPYIDRFRTLYNVTFEVPMSAVEQQTAIFTLTSSLGTASFEFPPVGSK